jgi:hypothetical protein
LVLGQGQEFSKDPTQVVEELTEAPNQSSEVSDTSAPTLTQEGKPQCMSQYFNLLPFHLYNIYFALRLGVGVKP